MRPARKWHTAYARALTRLIAPNVVDAFDEARELDPSGSAQVALAAERLRERAQHEFRELGLHDREAIETAVADTLDSLDIERLRGASVRSVAAVQDLITNRTEFDQAEASDAARDYGAWLIELMATELYDTVATRSSTKDLVVAATRELMRDSTRTAPDQPAENSETAGSVRDQPDGRVRVFGAAARAGFFAGAQTLRSGYTYPAEIFQDAEQGLFVGRGWLREQVDQLLASQKSGYVLLEADGGVGKTAFLASHARAHSLPHYFFRSGRHESLEDALTSICIQLICAWGLREYAQFTPAELGPNLFEDVISACSERRAQLGVRDPIVIVLDGLDESSGPATEVGRLPARLPDGVHVILSRRPGWLAFTLPHTPIRIDALDPRNISDMRERAARTATNPNVVEQLNGLGKTPEWFAETVVGRCCGLWVYATHILSEIEYGRRRVDELEGLPDSLWGYYRDVLASGYLAKTEAWEAFELPILGALGAAAESVTVDFLCTIAGTRRTQDVDRFLETRVRGFLSITYNDEAVETEPRISLYHRTARDFLRGQGARDWTANRPLLRQLRRASQAAEMHIAEHFLRSWGGLDKRLPGLADPMLSEQHIYAARNLAQHLFIAGLDDTLLTLLTMQAANGDPPGNLWQQFQLGVGERGAFERDLSVGIEAARRVTDHARQTGANHPCAAELHLSLIRASLAGDSDPVPPQLQSRLIGSQRKTLAGALEEWQAPQQGLEREPSQLPTAPQQREMQSSLRELARTAGQDDRALDALLGVIDHVSPSLRRAAWVEVLQTATVTALDGTLAARLVTLGRLPGPERLDYLSSYVGRLGDRESRIAVASSMLGKVGSGVGLLEHLDPEAQTRAVELAVRMGDPLPDDLLEPFVRSATSRFDLSSLLLFRRFWRDSPSHRSTTLQLLASADDPFAAAVHVAEVAAAIPANHRSAARAVAKKLQARSRDRTTDALLDSALLAWEPANRHDATFRDLLAVASGLIEPSLRAAIYANLAQVAIDDQRLVLLDACLSIRDRSRDVPRRGPALVPEHPAAPHAASREDESYVAARARALAACTPFLPASLRGTAIGAVGDFPKASWAEPVVCRLLASDDIGDGDVLTGWLAGHEDVLSAGRELRSLVGAGSRLRDLAARLLDRAASETGDRRARLLILASPGLDERAMRRALDLAASVRDPRSQGDLLSMLAHATLGACPEGFLEVIARVPNRLVRRRAANAIAPFLPDALLSRATAIAERNGDGGPAFVAQTLIAARLPVRQQTPRLQTAIMDLIGHGDERLTLGALRVVLSAGHERLEFVLLDALSSVVSDEALAAALGSSASPASHRVVDQLCRLVEGSNDPAAQLRMVLSFAGRIRGGAQTDRVMESLEKIQDPGARGWALRAIAGSLRGRQVDRALTIAYELADDGATAYAMASLVAHLRPRHAALVAARLWRLRDPWHRAWLLAHLADEARESFTAPFVSAAAQSPEGAVPELLRAFGARLGRPHTSRLSELLAARPPTEWRSIAVELCRHATPELVAVLLTRRGLTNRGLSAEIAAALCLRALGGELDPSEVSRSVLYAEAGAGLLETPDGLRNPRWFQQPYREWRAELAKKLGSEKVPPTARGTLAPIRPTATPPALADEPLHLGFEAAGRSPAWNDEAQGAPERFRRAATTEKQGELEALAGDLTDLEIAHLLTELGAAPGAVPPWLQAWQPLSKRSTRDRALVALARHIPVSSVPEFLSLVDYSTDDNCRFECISGIADTFSPDQSTRLLHSISGITQVGPRAWALRCVAPRIHQDTLRAAFLLLAGISDDGSRAFALEPLALRSPDSSWPQIVGLVDGLREPGPRKWILEQLWPVAPPASAAYLCEVCARTPEWEGRSAAVDALVTRIPVRERLPLLVEVGASGLPIAGSSLVRASDQGTDAPARDWLRSLRSDLDGANRSEAFGAIIASLGPLADAGGAPLLGELLDAISRSVECWP